MSLGSSRRVGYSISSSSSSSSSTSSSSSCLSVVVVGMVIFLLQIWVCCDCKAGAIRIFPDDGMAKLKEITNFTANNYNYRASAKEELFHKFSNGKSSSSLSSTNRTDKALEENKRRVPSCPDPLHN